MSMMKRYFDVVRATKRTIFYIANVIDKLKVSINIGENIPSRVC